MDLLLTDVLVCPRCGPPFGLILLADEVRERRVLEGWLGCANCRERYPVRGGFADLRPGVAEAGSAWTPGETRDVPGAGALTEGAAPTPLAGEAALRLAALMGLAPAPGRTFALVAGGAEGEPPGIAAAPGIAAIVSELEVVAVGEALRGWSEAPGVSRMAAGSRLPFFDRSVRGVALIGAAAGVYLEEGLRLLHPVGQLVVEPVPAEAERRIEAAGARVLAREGKTLVAIAAGAAGHRP